MSKSVLVLKITKSLLIGLLLFSLASCGSDTSSSVKTIDLNPGCEGRTVFWTDDTDPVSCEAVVSEGESGDSVLLEDTIFPEVGNVTVQCVNQNWVIEADSDICKQAPTGQSQILINLDADGTSRVYEYFSDAFAQINQGFNGSTLLDGYFLVSSLPNFVQVGAGYDQFPSEGDWDDILAVTYSVDGLFGIGTEQANITDVSGDVDPFIPGEGFILNSPYTTQFSNISGTVSLMDGELVSIDTLQATVTFVLNASALLGPGATIDATGTLTINSSGLFSLDAIAPAPSGSGLPDPLYEWDLTGSVNPDSYE